jgi:hypothetical protein
MRAFKELRLIAMSRSWNGQIGKLAYRGFQLARVMAIALIATLLIALIGLRTNESCHFFLQHANQSHADCLPQSLFHQLFKCFLTCCQRFDILLDMSHWYPPGDLIGELFASSGYQTPFLHTTQYTALCVCSG